MLHFRALSEGERILYVDAQIPHRALKLGVTERTRVIMHLLLTH